MNYAAIKKHDVANGPGVRVSLFVSGCTHACKGCFNREAWDFSYGQTFTEENLKEILDALSPSYIHGFSVLGGEPLEERNVACVSDVLQAVRSAYPEKDIWLYSGSVFEKDILPREKAGKMDILSYLDVLVDGPFVEEKKSLRLKFRGSENQRLIDVKRTLEAGEVVLWGE